MLQLNVLKHTNVFAKLGAEAFRRCKADISTLGTHNVFNKFSCFTKKCAELPEYTILSRFYLEYCDFLKKLCSVSMDFLILWWLERLLVLMLENVLCIKWDGVDKTYR